MSKLPIFVTRPSLPPLEDLLPYLEKIWESRLLSNGGPFHKQLEAELCDYLGVPNISLFSNATIALITALKALNITGEVITTPYSFVATTHSLLWNNLKPVFVDIDPISLNLDPNKIEAAITPATSAIMPVHVYGQPCDVDRIDRLAKRYNLKVIYDAAHAFGVKLNGGSVLNYGDLSVLSFHATKVFNTFEGGAVVCHNKTTYDYIDKLKNFALHDEKNVFEIGINGKMSEIIAALGILQLKHVNQYIEKREKINQAYQNGLLDVRGVCCVRNKIKFVSNYSYFPILINEEFPISRDALFRKMKERGVHARRYFYPIISEFSVYQNYKSSHPSNLPVATRVASQILCLPIYPDLALEEVDKICEFIRTQR